VGDQYYSTAKKPLLDENKHVLTEKRNFYAKPVRSGKGPDVYFSNMTAMDRATEKKLKEFAISDQEAYLKLAKSRKKGSADAPEFKAAFKPTGPQEYAEL
jgi:hypothetical protein